MDKQHHSLIDHFTSFHIIWKESATAVANLVINIFNFRGKLACFLWPTPFALNSFTPTMAECWSTQKWQPCLTRRVGHSTSQEDHVTKGKEKSSNQTLEHKTAAKRAEQIREEGKMFSFHGLFCCQTKDHQQRKASDCMHFARFYLVVYSKATPQLHFPSCFIMGCSISAYWLPQDKIAFAGAHWSWANVWSHIGCSGMRSQNAPTQI